MTDPQWVRGPADELALSEGCTFDEAAGAFVCDFIETFCCHSKGKWAGRPFELLDWQRDFIMRLFGWMRPDGTRRYRSAYLEVPKKNGKSMMVSALALYLLVADGEPGAEIYLNACDREQASIIYTEAERTIKASPGLRRRLEVIPSKKRIAYPEANGYIVANSAVPESKDGFSPHGVIFDELHRQKTDALWKMFTEASIAREQPLFLSITTAGEDLESLCYRQHEYTKQVNAGTVPDVSHLGVIYGADPEDDPEDPAVWRKANPSFGTTMKEEDFRASLLKAKADPTQWNNFLRLRLGRWVKGEDRFLTREQWDACKAEIDTDAHRGARAYGGGDLSSTTDLTASVFLVENEDDGFDVACHFWLPEDNVEDLERRDRVPYRAWAEQGYLTLTPGNVIDYEWLRRDLNARAAEYDLQKYLLDPYNATQLALQLRDSDGLPVDFLRQGFLSLSDPTKQLLRLVLQRKLRHDGNPLLAWTVANAVAVSDPAGNLKLDKKKSRQKIDGAAALVNATAGANVADDDSEPSVYETRGILTL